MEQKSYNGIDIIKFICAVLVVMIHFPPLGDSKIPAVKYINFGLQNYLARIAVPFFFIAAGFLLYRKSVADSIVSEYVVVYIKKILRLYVIWTLIYFPLMLRGFFNDPKGMLHAIVTYAHYTIFTGSAPQLWYLTALIFAVFLTSFLLYRKVRPATIAAIALVFYIAGLFAQSWFGFIAHFEYSIPGLWRLLKTIQAVIITTRDGLFDGFLFVSIGMCFAFYNYKMRQKKALIMFILSMTALLVEVFLLQYFGFAREHDMYLFLVPAASFMFVLAVNMQLPDSPAYKTIRHLSSLIFLYVLVYYYISWLMNACIRPMPAGPYGFLITLLFLFALSYTIILLSDKDHFKWLKKIYM